MRFSLLTSEKGFTLMELIVALGLVTLLLVLVVTGSIFVERFVHDWSDRDKLTEELIFIGQELIPKLERSQKIHVSSDSLVFTSGDLRTTTIFVDSGILHRNSQPISRAGMRVETLTVTRLILPEDSSLVNLDNRPSGLYTLTVVLSDSRGNIDTLRTTVRNGYEYFKYSQAQTLPVQQQGILTD